MYSIDITHYLDEDGNIVKDMPSEAKQLASFVALVVDFTSLNCPDKFTDTKIPCRNGGCFGETLSRYNPETKDIIWRCTNCSHKGVIRNWQNTKWDQRQVK